MITKKYKPILFTPENAQKVHHRLKTQTRRLVKPQPLPSDGLDISTPGVIRWIDYEGQNDPRLDWVARYQVFDVLYVREATIVIPTGPTLVGYVGAGCTKTEHYERKRPSMHMARAHCRTFCEVTGVKAERLWECSDEDARAEGRKDAADFIEHFYEINPAWRGKDPWVWVYTFRRVMPAGGGA